MLLEIYQENKSNLMKKLLLLLFLTSINLQAQYQITGQLNPPKEYNWVILYKIEGARQVFVKSEKIVGGKFKFELPTNAEPGAYRVNYKTEGNGFADFLFNKENVDFTFNPENAEQSISFKTSTENKLYQEYLKIVSKEQYKTDSLHIAYIKTPDAKIIDSYKVQLSKIASLQKLYLEKSKGKMVSHFIRATNRFNNPTLVKNPQEYLKSINEHFFDTVDFDNKALYNSTFLVDRITDYVFYMNYSEDPAKQTELHKDAINVVLAKATSDTFKKDIIEFIITQFVNSQNVDFADYVLNTYYKKLPKKDQSEEFIINFLEKTTVEVGRIAPEISWTEKGKDYKLSTLNDAQNYVLVFWSTGCGHCLSEIPILYSQTQSSKKTKVVAFSLEDNDKEWKKHIVK